MSIWESQSNFQEWGLSFYHVGPHDKIQGVRLGHQHNGQWSLLPLWLVDLKGMFYFLGPNSSHLGDGNRGEMGIKAMSSGFTQPTQLVTVVRRRMAKDGCSTVKEGVRACVCAWPR